MKLLPRIEGIEATIGELLVTEKAMAGFETIFQALDKITTTDEVGVLVGLLEELAEYGRMKQEMIHLSMSARLNITSDGCISIS
jgi:hypothetical protein